MGFNLNQLASYDEARALREYLNSTQQFADHLILAGDDQTAPAPVANPNFPWLPPITPRVGIYLPSWSAGNWRRKADRLASRSLLQFGKLESAAIVCIRFCTRLQTLPRSAIGESGSSQFSQ